MADNQAPQFDPAPYADSLMASLRTLGGKINDIYARPDGLPGIRTMGPTPSMYSPDGQQQPQTLQLIPPSNYLRDQQSEPAPQQGTDVSKLLDGLTGRPAPAAPVQQPSLPTQPATLNPSSPQAVPQHGQSSGPQLQPSQAGSLSQQGVSAGPDQQQVRYVTNGGTSTMQGGYGGDSQLAQWALARHFGQASPAAMNTANAQNAILAARNTPQYQRAYQQALQATGNPRLAVGQADALFATSDPTYAGNFINSGQDQKTQADFDAGIFRQNFAAGINPSAGVAAVKSGLPYWGTGMVGAAPDGNNVLQTPDGGRVEAPVGTSWQSLVPGLTGKVSTPAAQKQTGQMTEFQQAQIQNGQERNKQARITNLNSSLNFATQTLSKLMQSGAPAAQIQAQQAQVQRLTQQVQEASGYTPSASPIIINTAGGQ